MTTRPILFPDAGRSGDWIKTLGWDLPTGPAAFLRAIGGPDKLEHFLTLPAAEAMPQELLDALTSMGLSERIPYKEELHPRGGKNKGWFKKKLPGLKPWAFWDETWRSDFTGYVRPHDSTEQVHQLQQRLGEKADLFFSSQGPGGLSAMDFEEKVKAMNAYRVAQILRDDPEIAAAQKRWVEKWDAQGTSRTYVSPSLLGQTMIMPPMRWHLGASGRMEPPDPQTKTMVEAKMRELLLKHFSEIKKSPPEEGFVKTTRAEIKKMDGERLRGLYVMIEYQMSPPPVTYTPSKIPGGMVANFNPEKPMPEYKDLRNQIEQDRIRNDPAVFAEMVAQTVVLNWAHTANDEDKLAWLVQRAADKEFNIEDPFYMMKGEAEGFYMVNGVPYGGVEPESTSFRYAEDTFARQPDAEMLIRKVLRAQYVITQKELADAGIKEAVIYRGMSNVYEPDLLPALGTINPGERFTIAPNELDSFQGHKGADLFPPEVVGGSQPLTVTGVYGHLIISGTQDFGVDSPEQYFIEIADYGSAHTAPPVEIPLSPSNPLIPLIGHRAIMRDSTIDRTKDFDPAFTYVADYQQDMASVIEVETESGKKVWLPAERFVTPIDRPKPPPKPWSTVGEQPGKFAPLSSWTDEYGTAGDFGGSSEGGVMIGAMVPAERIHSMSTTGFGSYGEREMVVLGGTDQVFAVPGHIIAGQVDPDTLHPWDFPAEDGQDWW